MQTPSSSSGLHFATTRWSLVLAVGARSNEQAEEALSSLCQAYWMPLYAYARRRARDVHEARDLTQAFFERLLEGNYLAQADPQRGRFRSFLLTAFKHFLSKEWKRARALKRGGGRVHLPLDFEAGDSRIVVDVPGGRTPEELYEREWATTLLAHVLDRLKREMDQAGKRELFDRLKHAVMEDERLPYAKIAAELEMTESNVRMAATRLRRRYRDLVRHEIARTITSVEDVEDEIGRLFAIFSS